MDVGSSTGTISQAARAAGRTAARAAARTAGRKASLAACTAAAALAVLAAAAPAWASGWASAEQYGYAGELVPLLAKDDPQHQARVPKGWVLRVVKVTSPVLSEDAEDTQFGYNGRSYLGWGRLKDNAGPGEYPLSVTFDYVNPLDSDDTSASHPYVADGGTVTVAAPDGASGSGSGSASGSGSGFGAAPVAWALGGAAAGALATHGVHTARRRRTATAEPGGLD
uniref:Uncharacterized protein n=1 Tax=Streptomyces sp. NBC_00049 TaxID=2903617 RepID=A0AAU2JZJ6_9ACTN